MRWTEINAINQRIDNPTFQDKIFSELLSRYFPVPNLPQEGHRKHNHDYLSAMKIGFTKGGVEGIEAGLYHQMEDMISNQLRDTVGSEGRDIIEALLNYNFRRHRRHTALRRY